MLGEAGSIASIVGVAVSLFGLGFAIWQLFRLRGETRAAREASEETRNSVRRDLAIADATRLNERIQYLKELHWKGDWDSALAIYTEVRRGLTFITNRHPGLLEDDSQIIQQGVVRLREMERRAGVSGEITSPEMIAEFNDWLSEIQIKLWELESR